MIRARTSEQKLIVIAILSAMMVVSCNNASCPDTNSWRPMFSAEDQPYIDRAVRLWSWKTNSSPEQAMRSRYVMAMYFPEETCVSIQLETYGVGGEPIYCFNRKSEALTKRYDDVE